MCLEWSYFRGALKSLHASPVPISDTDLFFTSTTDPLEYQSSMYRSYRLWLHLVERGLAPGWCNAAEQLLTVDVERCHWLSNFLELPAVLSELVVGTDSLSQHRRVPLKRVPFSEVYSLVSQPTCQTPRVDDSKFHGSVVTLIGFGLSVSPRSKSTLVMDSFHHWPPPTSSLLILIINNDISLI